MSFTAPIFTDAGRALQARAIAGATLRFTQIKLGDGTFTGDATQLTDVVHNVITVAVHSATRNDTTATAKSVFNNATLASGFYWREVGLFAANPDYPDDRTQDILYCYSNAGDLAEYIPSRTSSFVEKSVSISVTVGSAQNVTVGVLSGIYVEIDDFDEHVDNRNNPHAVTVEQIGAAPASHVSNKNNPHAVTIAQIGAAAAGHTHGAATQTGAGFMSAADKAKLDGIAAGANNYTLPNATTSALGGVKIGTGLNVSSGTASVKYGSAAGTACQGNDSRLSDARTPTAHTHDDRYYTEAEVDTKLNNLNANLYAWTKRQIIPPGITMGAAETAAVFTKATNVSGTVTFYLDYYDDVTVDNYGRISGAGASKRISFNISSTYTNISTLKGKYLKTGINGETNSQWIYVAPTSPNVTRTTVGSEYWFNMTIQKVSAVETLGERTIVYSANRNAFPDAGESDGYSYLFQGKATEKAVLYPQIATGTYIGTGTLQKELTFDFQPQFVMLSNNYYSDLRSMVLIRPMANTARLTLAWGDKSLLMSALNDDLGAINNQGSTYTYVAFGI